MILPFKCFLCSTPLHWPYSKLMLNRSICNTSDSLSEILIFYIQRDQSVLVYLRTFCKYFLSFVNFSSHLQILLWEIIHAHIVARALSTAQDWSTTSTDFIARLQTINNSSTNGVVVMINRHNLLKMNLCLQICTSQDITPIIHFSYLLCCWLFGCISSYYITSQRCFSYVCLSLSRMVYFCL